MKTNLFALLGAGMVFFLASCATSSNAWKKIDTAVEAGNYPAGVAEIAAGQEGKKPIYKEDNVVSLYLDKGLIEHYAGNYADSAQSFGQADRVIQEAQTKSVTAEVASFIANDNTKEYAGEDYEDIYLNVFNALNYYHEGKLEDALVEIRNLTDSSGKLSLLKAKYAKDGEKLKEALDPVAKLGLPLPGLDFAAQMDYSDSALAHYISALFFRAAGKDDDARIELDAIAAAFAGSSSVYRTSVPASIAEEKNVQAGSSRLNIISFTGFAPRKVSATIPILFGSDAASIPVTGIAKADQNLQLYLNGPQFSALTLAKPITGTLFGLLKNLYTPANTGGVYELLCSPSLKLPILGARPDAITSVAVSVDGGTPVTLELIEDMSLATEQIYNSKFGSTLLKTSVRAMVKYGVAFAAAKVAAIEASKKSPMLADSAGIGVLVAAQKSLEATEIPDTRGARYLPGKAYVGGINLAPGTYNLTITYYAGGNPVHSEKKEGVKVSSGALNLVEGVCLK